MSLTTSVTSRPQEKYVLDLENVRPDEYRVTVHRTVRNSYHYAVQTCTMRGKLDVLVGMLTIRYPHPVVLVNGVLA